MSCWLNSDTIVTPRWIEKLTDAAYSSGDVRTVTPLSNHATLCSLPRPFEENLLPTGFDTRCRLPLSSRTFRNGAIRESRPASASACTSRRAARRMVSSTRSNFGLGYGEENDFCMRALARGWVHVADDATFIDHAGHRSFGASRARLQRRAAATLRRLHPHYMPTIAAFMRPIRWPAFARESSTQSRRHPSQRRKIVHLVHGWPPFQQAGTELYAYWLARQQQTSDEVSVYVRAADPARAHGEAVELLDDGIRVRLVTNNFTARNRFAATPSAIGSSIGTRTFSDADAPRSAAHSSPGRPRLLARRRRAPPRHPIVLQIQDWWFLCARVNLYDRDGNRCTGTRLRPSSASRSARI